ncbi:MAG: hypothetical protein ACT4O9_03500 [Blastocatellia bacterium]
MFRSKLFSTFLAVFVSLVFSAAAFGQTAPVRGVVKLQQADGTKVPVAEALVEPFRVDIEKGKSPSAKTNKKGEFNFAGFQLGFRFVLSVSGPNISPILYRDVRAGMESIEIVVFAGDGKQWTEEEVRANLKMTSTGTAPTAQSTAEAKKAEEEYQKKLAKYNEEKAKAEDANKIVNAALKAGADAFTAKNYDLAIAKFEEGYAADPEFEGSAPILLNYKGVALKDRAFSSYERAMKGDAAAKAAELGKAKEDFAAATQAFDRGLEILGKAATTDAQSQQELTASKRNILANYIEVHRLMVMTKADTTRATTAVPVYEQYFASETDAAKKLKARINLGDLLREAGESEPAVAAYRAVLEESPNDPDALAGIGLSLFNLGVISENKPQMQEGLNFMQRFADTAPDTHKLKASVKEAVEYLKTEQKLAPVKTAPARRRN